MKYVLVDCEDNIIDRIELTREVSLSAAKTFFVGRKRIEEKEFDNLWKVMTEMDYNRNKERTYRYEEFGDWLDIEKS
tara:strand:- start:361 stop:591 length:231 start_codon:yes stop_codon:yes gene_type:complete